MLNALTQVSREYDAFFGPLLYKHVTMFATRDRSVVNDVLAQISSHSRCIEGISILNWWKEDGTWDNFDDDGDADNDLPGLEDFVWYDVTGLPNSLSRLRDLALSLNKVVQHRMVLMDMPRLVTFEWLHRFPVSRRTLKMILDRYSKSLKQLRLFQNEVKIDCVPHGSGLSLEVLECRSIGTKVGIQAVIPLIRSTASTLRSLTLGREWDIYEDSQQNSVAGMMGDAYSMLSSFDIGSDVGLHLEHLCLIGFRLNTTSPKSFLSTVNLSKLKSLTLESCENHEPLLRQLATATSSNAWSSISLTKFCFRAEIASSTGVQDVASFLASFSGLVTLSVLFDNVQSLPSVDCLIKTHATTLKTLVWAGRSNIRGFGGNGDVYPGSLSDPSSDLSKVFENCDLECLSVNYQWYDHRDVRIKRSPAPCR